MYRNVIILILFVFVVLAVVWLQHLPGKGPAETAPAALRPMNPSGAGEFRGICLQLHKGSREIPYETFITEIARTGANTICLVVHGYQENTSSGSIFIDARKTPSNRRLGELIDCAHEKGLRVILIPVVLLAKRRGNEWRGKIKPDNWNEWWEDYNHFILHYAAVAQAGGVEVFSVGSELISTETQTDRWKQLIAAVRKVYTGRLTYSANWDHYEVPRFWGDLDIIGMTSYFTLAKVKNPALKDLLGVWAGIKRDILKWQKTINRPILFTEVGWPNQVTAAEFPWNYYASPDEPDPILQANCFESFFATWINEKPVAGFLIWEWRNGLDQPTSPQKDTSYRPMSKPAMKVIRKYFQAPGASATAPGTASSKPQGNPDELPNKLLILD